METSYPTPDDDRGNGPDDEVDVLLVDDDRTWVQSTAELLERQRDSFVVRTATDLTSASAAFARADPDCVVCDYDLGGGTGLDLLAEVRDRDDDLPFILVTGQGSESVASDAIGRQVTDYIPKRSLGGRDPLLARRVESAVDTYRTRRALRRERRSKEAMLDIVTATSSREDLAGEFCDHMVRERGYACAWIGTVGQSGDLVLRAAAGSAEYPDTVLDPEVVPETGSEPGLVALASGEPVSVSPIGDEDDPQSPGHELGEEQERGPEESDADAEWRAVAATYGFQTALAAPIVYHDSTFGVLAVYDTDAGVGPGEQDLLAEYGETVGYAFRSATWKESLLSTSAVALDLTVADDDAPLVDLGSRLPAESRLEVLTTVGRSGTLLYVLEVSGTTAERLHRAATEVGDVDSLDVTASGDPFRCELVVSLPTPESVLAAHGGRVTGATVEHGRVTITAVPRSEEDIGSLVDGVRSVYPGAEVQSVRSTDVGRRRTTAEDLLDSLTDRQREALELAYYNGYFERPRDHTKTEVAEKFGVSRQTFTQHLRAAHRHLLSGVLDGP